MRLPHRMRLRAMVDRQWSDQFSDAEAEAMGGVAAQIRPLAELTPEAPLSEVRNLVEQLPMMAIGGGLGRPRCEGPGCVGCCHGPIPVLSREIAPILEVASPEVIERARALAALDDDDPRLMSAPCPALDPRWRTCTVYAERPIVCRSHVSWGDPAECWPGKSGATSTAMIVGGVVEIMRAHGAAEVVLIQDGLAAPNDEGGEG